MKKLFYTTVLCLLASTLAFAQTNLVTNPGFESGVTDGVPDGWTHLQSDLSTYEIATDTVYAGNNSLKASMETTTSLSNDDVFVQYVPITSGKTYNLSVWYNIQGIFTKKAYVYLRYGYMDADGNTLNNGGTIGGDFVSGNVVGATSVTSDIITLQTWNQLTMVTTESAPSNAAYLIISIKASRCPVCYFDNASVTEAGAASINETTADQNSSLPVRKDGDNLIVTTKAGKTIEVYSILGTKLQSKVVESDETVIAGLPKGQVLIVRSGNAVAKVML